MKKLVLFLFVALIANISFSQTAQKLQKKATPMKAIPQTSLATPAVSGFENYLPVLQSTVHPIAQDRNLEELVGRTYYDLQTNNSMADRIVLRPDGAISATYTVAGSSNSAFLGRGTAYNHKPAGGAFAAPDTNRLENTRTGFTNLVLLANGTEATVAHTGAGDPVVMTKASGATTFTQQTLTKPRGCFWFRASAGGADGNSIHIIGITTPIANQGTKYEGVDGKLLYWRSTDGGVTWDKNGASFAVMDSTVFNSMDGDTYAIDADGDHIAIAIFNQWNDSVILESFDNGNTWTKTIFFDFPLDNYANDAGYDETQIPPSPIEADPLAIETTDGSGDVIIAIDGTVHVFYGRGIIVDSELADNNTQFYSPVNGINYWNSNTQVPNDFFIGMLDINGNDTLDITNTGFEAYRGNATVSFPTIGFDENANMVMVYSGVVEGLEDSETARLYRHIYAVYSPDLGENWFGPVDLINLETIGDEFLLTITEAVYPSIAKKMDQNLHLLYMADYNPFTYVGSLNAGAHPHPVAYSDIKYITKNIEELFTISTIELGNPTYEVSVAPNPATDILRIAIKSDNQFDGQWQLINQLGQVVTAQNVKFTGNFAHSLPVNALAKGMYFLRVSNVDGSSSVVKVVVN